MASAPMNKTVKWILIAVLIVVVIAIVILIINHFSKPAAPANNTGGGGAMGGGNTNVGAGIIDILTGVFNNIFGSNGMADPACDKSNKGYDNNGFYTTKCGGVAGGGDGNCDPANPGKDMNA